jgi:hypothetical protein
VTLEMTLRTPQGGGQARLARRPLLPCFHGSDVTRVAPWGPAP